MSSTDIERIKKEIEDTKTKLKSRKIGDEEKEIYRDKIKDLTQQLQSALVSIEKKVVPVETNSVIADNDNAPTPSRFIKSNAFVL